MQARENGRCVGGDGWMGAWMDGWREGGSGRMGGRMEWMGGSMRPPLFSWLVHESVPDRLGGGRLLTIAHLPPTHPSCLPAMHGSTTRYPRRAPPGAPLHWGCPSGGRCNFAHGDEELRGEVNACIRACIRACVMLSPALPCPVSLACVRAFLRGRAGRALPSSFFQRPSRGAAQCNPITSSSIHWRVWGGRGHAFPRFPSLTTP